MSSDNSSNPPAQEQKTLETNTHPNPNKQSQVSRKRFHQKLKKNYHIKTTLVDSEVTVSVHFFVVHFNG
jgi:hypothetical protein